MVKDYKKRIYGFECDIYGHLNNANYLHLLEESRSEAMWDIDMPVDKLLELGWHVYIHRYEVDFIKPLMLEEFATVRSTILELNRARSKWLQEVYNSRDELCFQAFIYVVHVKDGKPARVPDEIWERFLLLK
ncbi:MAG: thioesterase [Candidatus Cloacimonetes bacterium HGW-Cloacimonetes-2]|jgi:YbgC/YbaW family acyl-CoA thioester hydrolase|nr:MAG: thioesterase [Candidatus Cloacimonetes bacterium HGW-Cloacimonetes-2]